MQDCAAAALDLVFPAGQPSQEAAYPLLHRRSASQAQVPGRLFPRPSPNGFICVEVWAVARQIHQPQPQARPAQILPHRLATMGWGIIPDYLKRPKVPLAQLVQKGCRGSAVAVSLQFPPVPSIPPLPSPDTPPNSSWLSRHTADCWSSPGLALPAAPTGPATPHRHGSGPRRRRISWLRSLLPPLAFFCVFHLGFGLARCGPSRRGAGRAFAVGPVERVAADLAAVGGVSPTAARPQPVLADLQHPSPADVPVARRQAGAGGPGMAAAAQERCVTAWPPSWGSDNASPPPSTGSGLRTDGGRLSPFCLRTWSWPIPATWWQTTFGCAMAPGRTSWRPGSRWAHG